MNDQDAAATGKAALKAGAWYTTGNLLLKGCSFLSLPFFTYLMTTNDFGIYNSYIAYEQLLIAILGLGMYGTVKIAKIEFADHFDGYMKVVAGICLICTGVCLVFTNAFYNLYNEVLGFSRFVMNCLVLQSLGGAFMVIYGAKLNIEFKYKSFIALSAFNVLGNIGISLLLIIFVFPNEMYLGRILGSAAPLVAIAVIVPTVLLACGKVAKADVMPFVKYALSIGLPLVPHALSQAILGQFDRIMVGNLVGMSEAGIYSYMYTLCTILYVVQNSMDNAWTPWMYIAVADSKGEQVRKSSSFYIVFSCALTLGFMCVMPEIARLMAGESYWGGIGLIAPLSLGNYFIFLYTLPVNVEYFHKKTALISIGTIGASAMNIGLNYLTIPLLGYSAAAYTTAISYAALFVFHWLVARRLGFNELYNMRVILITIVLVIGIGLLFSAISVWPLISVAVRYGIVLCLCGYMFINRRLLFSLVRKPS